MIEVLKVPVDKLARRDLDDARRRVISLSEVLGRIPAVEEVEGALLEGFREHLGLDPQWGEPTAFEEELARRLYEKEYGTEEFVHLVDAPGEEPAQVSATLVRRGGSVRADIRLEGERIREALITGDFFISPARAVLDLEASLRGTAISEAGATVVGFFDKNPCETPGLSPLDFREVVESALGQIRMRAAGHELRGHWRGPRPAEAPTLVFLHDALGSVRLWRDFPDQLVRASGCGALIYDRWGSGESEPLVPPWSDDYLREEALLALPEVLDATGVREAILIGQSDGASIALAHAGAFPARIRGVIAMSPHFFLEPCSRETIRKQVEDFEHGDLKARLRRHHGDRTEALFGRLVAIWTAEGPGASARLEPYVARLRCPVLAIQGEDDEFFSAAQLERLADLIPGRVETLRIPRAAHYPMHQARNEVLAASIRFIARSLGEKSLQRRSGAAVGEDLGFERGLAEAQLRRERGLEE
jgi:pimeloyl-ACP methyl ester carboxylesterase